MTLRQVPFGARASLPHEGRATTRPADGHPSKESRRGPAPRLPGCGVPRRIARPRARRPVGHETSWDRWADLERDIAGLISGSVTTRLGWGQVLQPCRAASAVGQLLVAVGWDG